MKRLKVTLNLYSNNNEASESFEKEALSSDVVRVIKRDRQIEKQDDLVIYRAYKDYDSAKSDLLGKTYQQINYHLDLPDNVKQHFQSRIRPLVD